MWQADVTHWRLADTGHAEILNMLDDHSRLFVASRAFPTVKAADVVDVFRMAVALHGAPASLLCDPALRQQAAHIGIGRAHKGQSVKLLIADRDIRILALDTGELIRRLTLDPSCDYQRIGGG